jgi:hypothetical protein
VYRARLAYPEGFAFRGFHALGPVNSAVGAYELDVDLRDENVTVSFDGFSQTLPGSAFSSTGGSHQFHHGAPPGIEHFWIWADGRFQIDIRDLRLGDTGGALTFSLRIGNDVGDTTVPDASEPPGAK